MNSNLECVMAKIKGFYKLILSFLMTILGFSSCSKHDSQILYEYGTPYEKFKLSGTILDKNDNPVSNVRIKIKQRVYLTDTDAPEYSPFPVSKPISDKNGKIYSEISLTPDSKSETVLVVFNSEGNTEEAQMYKDDSLEVKKIVVNNKKSGWQVSEAEGSFTLKLKDK